MCRHVVDGKRFSVYFWRMRFLFFSNKPCRCFRFPSSTLSFAKVRICILIVASIKINWKSFRARWKIIENCRRYDLDENLGENTCERFRWLREKEIKTDSPRTFTNSRWYRREENISPSLTHWASEKVEKPVSGLMELSRGFFFCPCSGLIYDFFKEIFRHFAHTNWTSSVKSFLGRSLKPQGARAMIN